MHTFFSKKIKATVIKAMFIMDKVNLFSSYLWLETIIKVIINLD
jgi:hypothetical protein